MSYLKKKQKYDRLVVNGKEYRLEDQLASEHIKNDKKWCESCYIEENKKIQN